MDKLHMSIPLCAKIQPYSEPHKSYELKSNTQFTVCKCYVQGLGKNQNLSYFSKDVVEKSLPSLFNIPVIGHIKDKDDGGKYMGSHDVMVVINNDGVDIKSVCIPYGVVPLQDSAHFEMVTNPADGTQTEYLVCDVILWTGRYPELMDAAYSDNFYFNQSMEIEATSYRDLEEDPRYVEVLDFEYSALCLLGKADDKNSKEHTEPCFPMASVVPYEYNLKTESFADMMGQLKYALASCFIRENSKEGGNKEGMPNEVIDSIFEEFSIERDSIDFEITEDMTEDELRNHLLEMSQNADNDDGVAVEEFDVGEDDTVQATAEVPPAEVPTKSTSYRQRAAALAALFPDDCQVDDEGNVISETYYWVCDFTDEYVYVDVTHYEGGAYTEKHGRYAISFNDEDHSVSLNGDFEEMVMRWLTPDELSQLENMRSEYEGLVEFKRNRLESDAHKAMDEVINEFADICNTDEFAAIRENPYQFESVDALRTACFAARGRIAQPKIKQDYSARMPINADENAGPEDGGRYGDLFDRFGHRK